VEQLGEPEAEKRTSRGALAAWIPAPGVMVTRAEGHIDVELAALFIHTGNEVVRRHGKLLGFHHWWSVNGYDTDARTRLTEWGYRIRGDVERVNFLVSSKIVRMGISVASIVLVGMLVPHDDPAAFEALVHRTVAERRRR
jgi:hypothetical protein